VPYTHGLPSSHPIQGKLRRGRSAQKKGVTRRIVELWKKEERNLEVEGMENLVGEEKGRKKYNSE
jgi:hypothetical protein